MPKIYQRATARLDLVEHFVYLAENTSLDMAERFLTNAQVSFSELADQPMMGAPQPCGILPWSICVMSGFDNVSVLLVMPIKLAPQWFGVIL